jgi:dTDP-4-dehydrorhamnose 3,5-epimerase-like enzyme
MMDIYPKIIPIPKISEPRGNLGYVEARRHVPFTIERVYYINDVPGGTERGSHAHKQLQQLLIPLSGSFTVMLNDGETDREYGLNRSHEGLFLPPGYWRTLKDFTSGTVLVVLASAVYDPEDYISDYNDFLNWRNAKKLPLFKEEFEPVSTQ